MLNSLIVCGHFSSESGGGGEAKPMLKPEIDVRESTKASIPQALLLWPMSTRPSSKAPVSVSGAAGLGPGARVLEPGLCHLRQQRGRRLLPKLLMSFPRLAATRPAASSCPFTPCFPAYITGLGITLPALLAVPPALLQRSASLFQ